MDKTSVLNELMTKLFEADQRRLGELINILCIENKELKKSKVDGFLYGGAYYKPNRGNITVASAGQSRPPLDDSLWTRMEEWLKERKALDTDHDLIRQILFKLLKPCGDTWEIRSALPECVIPLVQGLADLTRTRDCGFTLEGDERATRQFAKLLPRIEAYSVARLLF